MNVFSVPSSAPPAPCAVRPPPFSDRRDAFDVERLLAGQPQARAVLARQELQRQHAHAHQVGAVDALEALRDHRRTPSSSTPFAAQSRDEPEPYSLPARITSGTPSFWYCIEAS